MKYILILLCFFAISSTYTETNKLSLAVSDFIFRAVSENDAAAMADRLSAELSATNAFKVLERTRMKDVFAEAAFQQTWCDEPACATAIGKLISVQKLVLGSISKVGSIYTINIRLVDVGTGEVEKNLSEDCDCAIEELLVSVLKRMAGKIAGTSGSNEGAIVSLDKGNASLFVKSIPDGAKVFVNGRIIEGLTPLTIQGLPAGRHDIRVQKNDSSASVLTDLSSRKIKRLKLKLKKEKTTLKIFTEPSEAEVFINSIPRRSNYPNQISPAVFNNFNKDSARIYIFRNGFFDTTAIAIIRKNRENVISLKLVEGDTTYKKLQDKFIKSRWERRLGFKLSVSSITLAMAGTAALFMAEKDFSEANDLKTRLDNASIRTGSEYDAVKALNKEKHDSGQIKQNAGIGIISTGAFLGLLGIYFYF